MEGYDKVKAELRNHQLLTLLCAKSVGMAYGGNLRRAIG